MEITFIAQGGYDIVATKENGNVQYKDKNGNHIGNTFLDAVKAVEKTEGVSIPPNQYEAWVNIRNLHINIQVFSTICDSANKETIFKGRFAYSENEDFFRTLGFSENPFWFTEQ